MLLYLLERGGEWPVKVLEVMLFMWAAVILKTDYSFKGILLISMFYFLREYRWVNLAAGALWNFLWNNPIQEYGVLAAIPLALYNGERGRSMKYFFYLFYPLHLMILFLIVKIAGLR